MKIRLADKEISDQSPTFIVAELSCNHLGDFELAKKTLIAAKEAGADAIKLQTYTADTMTIPCDNPNFQISHGTLWDGMTLHKLYQEAMTPWEWHKPLFDLAKELDLICFSTPFDKSAVDFLETLNTPVYKLASFEIHDIPLIRYIARQKKPIIMSKGMATLEDLERAVQTCREEGNDQIILLQCTSTYPTALEEANLRTIPDMAARFGCLVGLSDHTSDLTAAITSIALGAKVIEKHLILDRELGAHDAAFSITPEELKTLVQEIRKVEKLLGRPSYDLPPRAEQNKKFSRSLYIVKDVAEGEELTEENVRSIRPGNGMHPMHLPEVLGQRAARSLRAGTPLEPNLIQEK
ncbi:pseudaminic acid synthase [Patescibacteria group bacterium]|nr:pseudaminic acid synthase [Patescibacteria group bacterium]